MSISTRRGFVGGSLALASLPIACRQGNAQRATPEGGHHGAVPARAGVLAPGPEWAGVAGSGGLPPAQSDVPCGTLVPDERFTGGFSAVPGQWVHGQGVRITALGLPPQAADSATLNHVREAVFFLEGSSVTVTEWTVNPTPVPMPDGTMAPQGSIGFSVEIGAGSGTVSAGEAILYCTLRGEHGLERQIALPLVINVDRSLDAERKVGWVDPVAGDDAAPGTHDLPWRSLFHALGRDGVGNGGLVMLARAGRYLENVNEVKGVSPLDNARMIEVRAAPGLKPEQVVVTRDARLQPDGRWAVMAKHVLFQGITIDLGKILTLEARGKGWVMGFSGCRLVDPAGPNGPVDARGYDIGYNLTAGPPALRDGVNSTFYSRNGGVFLTECLLVNYVTIGARLYRNVVERHATDCFAGGTGYDDVVVDGYFATMEREFHQRLHVDADLVVASVERSGPNARVHLAATPALAAVGQRPDCQVQIVSGAQAGPDGVVLLGLDPVSHTVLMPAEAGLRLVPGDRLRCYLFWHPDFCQEQGVQAPTDRGMRNITLFRYVASSPSSQLFLTQANVALVPGTEIATTGRHFTLAGAGAPNVVLSDDVLHLTDGPHKGQYRLVDSFEPASQSGTLLEPFDSDVPPTPVGRGKSLVGLAVALSVLHKWGQNYNMGQFCDGHRNIVMAQNMFISQPMCLIFRSHQPGHGHRNHVHLHNIVSRIDADGGDMPTMGLRFERCHFIAGKVLGQHPSAGPLALALGTQGEPPALHALPPPIGVKPLVPFDLFGRRVDALSPVGPLVA